MSAAEGQVGQSLFTRPDGCTEERWAVEVAEGWVVHSKITHLDGVIMEHSGSPILKNDAMSWVAMTKVPVSAIGRRRVGRRRVGRRRVGRRRVGRRRVVRRRVG